MSTATQVVVIAAATASLYGLHRGYGIAYARQPTKQQKKLGASLAGVSAVVLAAVVAYVVTSQPSQGEVFPSTLLPSGAGSSAFDLPPPPPVGNDA